jgi:DNA cross-link repair 1A protein
LLPDLISRCNAQLSEYAPLLTAAPGLSWRQLCHVTDDDALQALGVAALGPRLRMLASLAAFRAGLTAADTAADAAPEAAATSAAQPAAKRRAVTTLAPERSIAAYFGGGSSSAPVPRAAAPVPPRSRHGGAGSAKTAAAQPGKPRGRAAPRPRAADASAPVPLSSLPPWQRIEGAAFVIDSFGGVGRRAEPCTAHFLTHFHSDHYGGLSATWPADKPIFCTAVTARLAALRLRVPHAAFRVLPLGRRTTLAGCGVTLLEANHCPGAAMLLFEPPPPAPPTLHTGDCRWDDARMRAALEPHLAALRDRSALRLVLDTTYGCPLTRAVFPPAADAAAFVAAAVAAEAFNPRTLFLFGAYTIGKEAVFLEAARAANKLVYCGAAKRAVLDCLGLPAADLALITGDERATNLHVVPMQSVGFAAMKGVLAHYKGRFNCCVGFAPTGWSFARGQTNAAKARGAGGGLGRGCRQARGASLVRYSVPYSEHSSFFELRAALRYLRPQAICPSVANDQGPKAAAMVAALLAPADEAAE